ncbi:MAG: porin family protein [Bacteroidota bacterium]
MIKTKLFMLAVLCSFFAMQANGQGKFGFKAGANLATIGGDARNADSKLGLHAGMTVRTPINDQWATQFDVVYSVQGDQSSLSSDIRSNYNYLNVPFVFKFYPEAGFNVQAGVQAGILVAANTNLFGTKRDIRNDLSTFDFGIPVGLGYDFDQGFGLDFRYFLGLTNTNPNASSSFPNRVLQFSITYILN